MPIRRTSTQRLESIERRQDVPMVAERGDKLVSLGTRLDTIEAQVAAVDAKVNKAIIVFLVLGFIVNTPSSVLDFAQLWPSIAKLLGL